jgi:hypothetical protein
LIAISPYLPYLIFILFRLHYTLTHTHTHTQPYPPYPLPTHIFSLSLTPFLRLHTQRSSFIETEADEEEEDGAQTGLGDYGFGTTANFKDRDDEKVSFDFS